MPSKRQNELLPPGWMVSQKIQKKGSGYYLNTLETLRKLKEHAQRPKPLEQETKRDDSMSLRFSTGAYMEAVVPLLKYWKDEEGALLIPEDTDGIKVEVKTVETTVENGGKTVQTIVKLDVHGEKVTITCYDTTVSMRIQGQKWMEQFYKRALLPYLQHEIRKHATRIEEINQHFQQLGSNGSNINKRKNTKSKTSKMISEQQIDESDTESELDESIISVGSEKQEDDVLEIEDLTERNLPEQETNKVAVVPDDDFCRENNLTPAPKALWVDTNLPKGWNTENNLLTGRSLPGPDLTALLAAVHSKAKAGEITLEENAEGHQQENDIAQDIGVEGAIGMETASTSAPELERHENLIEQGQKEASSSEVAGGSSTAAWMEGQGTLTLDPLRPTHDTTGDVMRFQSEMKRQSERLEVMEKREQRLEELIRLQSQKITSLQQSVQEVVAKLEGHPTVRVQAEPSSQGAEALPTLTTVPRSQEARGARSRLPRAPEPRTISNSPPRVDRRQDRGLAGAQGDRGLNRPREAEGLGSQRAGPGSQGTSRRVTLKCDKCDHTTTNERRMNNHVRNIHMWTRPSKASSSLLVGDSHLSSIDLREVEKCLGRKAMLFMPGAARPREDRAYCSTPDWPGARYPENSLQQMVPELLGERNYTNLILLAPTNDITNLEDIDNKQEQERLAAQSARNTVDIAVKALQSVEKVLIMEQPARVDNMAELSEFSKKKLREFVASCTKAGSIKIGSSQTHIVASKENRAEVFGKPTKRKADGIHMRGVGGKKFLTETINEALQYSGLGDNDMRLGKERKSGGTGAGVEGGARPSPRLEEQRSSWAEVANNCYSPSPHCQT